MTAIRSRSVRMILAGLVLTLIATACSGPPEASGPTEPGIVGNDPAVAQDRIDRSGPFTVTVFHEQGEGAVDVDLVAPADAAEVQIAFEPTFSNAPWRTIGAVSYTHLTLPTKA